ncbi:unnamed protein product [Fraxinus pennsylvanica]|uniref:Methylesterase 11, chloroplastic n=1 Tax=Fraxinus pennsylvanica TaxID=56036 RepID=A0AAD2EAM2_9LAMI|nr:unnamed protein product [Fraxinus pennsylvanica]
MGLCLSRDNKSTVKKSPPSKRITNRSAAGGGGSMRIRSLRKEDDIIHEQALAAALLLQQQLKNGSAAPFDRSSSLRYPSGNSKRNQALNRSSSSRTRSLTDPLLQPHQLFNQDIKLDNIDTNHFVLVHGGGFGAWCWYKTIALLEEGGYKVTAIDLTGSRIHSFDIDSFTSLPQYVKPLTDFFEKFADGENLFPSMAGGRGTELE